jgi:EmrB/QacA subfamily drug resistance transporter
MERSKDLTKRQIVFTMVGLMLGVLMSALDTTIVGTAMPRVIGDLSGMNRYAWPFTAYLLCSTIVIPIFGKLADSLGRRAVFLGGIAEFILASAICGFSSDMTQLIVFRGLQGLGGGIIVSNAFALAGSAFPPRERGKYIGFIAAMYGVASIIGPSIGGFITDTLGWRWIFYVNLPLGAIAFFVLMFGLAGHKEAKIPMKADVPGMAFFILSLAPLLIALSMGGRDYPWISVPILVLLGAAAVFVVLFVLAEGRAKDPVLPLYLFKDREFAVSAAGSFFANAVFFAGILLFPLYMQSVLHATASGSGLAITPMLLAYIVASIVGGQVISRIGKYRGMSIIFSIVAAAGTAPLCFLNPSLGPLPVILAMIVLGAGLGVNTPVYQISAQNRFPQRQIGMVTSGVMFFRNMGMAVGSAVFGSLLTGRVGKLIARVDWGGTPADVRTTLSNPQVLMNSSAIQAISDHVPAVAKPAFNDLVARLGLVLSDSIAYVFIAVTVFAALALAMSFVYQRGVTLASRSDAISAAAGRPAEGNPAATAASSPTDARLNAQTPEW